MIINTAAGWIHTHRRDWSAALDAFRIAMDLDRNFGLAWLWQGYPLLKAGRPREAVESARTASRLMNGAAIAQAFLGHTLAVTGDTADARAVLDELLSRAPNRYVAAFFPSLIHLGLGDNDGALAWLDRALAERSHWLTFLNVDPRWDLVRAEPRFQGIVRQVGLPGVASEARL